MSYLKRIVGYSSTGLVIEHVFHLLIGAGANAKSTLLEALRQVFGDYARQTDFGTFLESKGERIRNDLAGLAGTRLVIAAEADPERAISESTIKQITGGDAISARFLFKEFFEFRPQLKLWLAANHRPRIKRNDRAMWRRLRMIPANADFSDETKRDKDMSKKLEAELPGILVWVVEGAREWQREGLTPPQCVLEATQAYRATEDTVGNFIGEECVLGEKLKVAPKQLADAYKRYCEECAVEPVGQRDFVGYLQSRNLEQTRTGGRRYWVGIGLCDICPI
jgi:putative DNA primase/helicase